MLQFEVVDVPIHPYRALDVLHSNLIGHYLTPGLQSALDPLTTISMLEC